LRLGQRTLPFFNLKENVMAREKKTFAAGDTVRLTRNFLRWTGQITGGEGHSRWTVLACECKACAQGHFVLTNEPRTAEDLAEYFTPEEIAAEPWLKFRHLNTANVEHVRPRGGR
jgi:hypothetical protein